MKVLVLGGTGMLGHMLAKRLPTAFETAITCRESDGLGFEIPAGLSVLSQVNALNTDSLERAFDEFSPEVVVNCIGVIKQRENVNDSELTIAINALFPHQLARFCRDRGARLVHLSTDCVFSGEKGAPYLEDDFPDARDLYGRSKLIGEVGGDHCITLRTSIIGPEINQKRSLLEWVMSHERGASIQGYTRALYSGFTTLEMANIVADVLSNHGDLSGVYQVASEAISKHELIVLVNRIYDLGLEVGENRTFFCDRRLDGSRFQHAVGYTPPPWPQMLEELRDFMHTD